MLGKACDERIAVGKAADGLALPFPVLDDGTDVRAPIAGVVAGLRAAEYHVVLFLPVDVPLISVAALTKLANACAQAAVPQSGPLPGAYARDALPVFESRLEQGELALTEALGELQTRVVQINPALLVNVNTPNDLEAVRLWPGPEGRRSLLRRLLPAPTLLVLAAGVFVAIGPVYAVVVLVLATVFYFGRRVVRRR